MNSTQSRIQFYVLIVFAPALLGAYLFAQSDASAGASKSDSPVSTIGAGMDCSEFMRQLDADGDNVITQNEWIRAFSKYDKNDDNRLSAEEIQAISSQGQDEDELESDSGRIEAFVRLDKNRNDTIDNSEWPGKEEDFRFLDSNQDGSISREEFLSTKGRWWNEPFENMDFNNNNVIDRSEWLDSRASFDRLDRDRNGVIERREFYNPR